MNGFLFMSWLRLSSIAILKGLGIEWGSKFSGFGHRLNILSILIGPSDFGLGCKSSTGGVYGIISLDFTRYDIEISLHKIIIINGT